MKIEVKILSVKEIVDMIDRGELHSDQSTQRAFIYKDIKRLSFDGVLLSKSGIIIKNIIEKDDYLPAITFWHNTDNDNLNIHDGKQRIMSIYHFIKDDAGITTDIKGKSYSSFESMTDEQKNKLLDYKFVVQINYGNTEQEEEGFYRINTSAENLTNYECVHGMFYGEFLNGFERAVSDMSKSCDSINPIKRGEQAYQILLTIFNIVNEVDNPSEDRAMTLLRDKLRQVRDNPFKQENYRFNDIMLTFDRLRHVGASISHKACIREEYAFILASYIIRNNLNVGKIIDELYTPATKGVNDISAWRIPSHLTFIKEFITNGIKLDARRFFSNDDKSALYTKWHNCMHRNENGSYDCNEDKYDRLEVDHIIPWSKGGRTTLDNAQLLCKKHNSGKGNRE